ncbi:septal ring lytic transglycosylase RlpA family protein [Emcibacter sp.]|uniref:septal ring lytic transglycosylase RlpA family protein n=1 Tax=Emcibacter sp. TaxID=1979954 RepID=UPI002AA6764E|nr:septal ring lytic transglycosylase RlpA family protein [Emcibacter sp.]
MMMVRHLLVLFLLAALGACSSMPGGGPVSQTKGEYKVGNPYKVAGKVYVPEEDPHYLAEGMASWYGPKFHGRRTANGETFNMNALTAAHTTLPMPSYVRVTNLENGRSLILKVNDRGPFVGDRLIDVSRRSAQLLGFEQQGVTRVRVEAVSGPDARPTTAFARNNVAPKPAVAQKAPVVLARNSPAQTPTLPTVAKDEVIVQSLEDEEQTSDAGSIYVQIGAFADKLRAQMVADDIRHVGRTLLELVDINGQRLYRVRIGPLQSQKRADETLGRALAWGHNTARIVLD